MSCRCALCSLCWGTGSTNTISFGYVKGITSIAELPLPFSLFWSVLFCVVLDPACQSSRSFFIPFFLCFILSFFSQFSVQLFFLILSTVCCIWPTLFVERQVLKAPARSTDRLARGVTRSCFPIAVIGHIIFTILFYASKDNAFLALHDVPAATYPLLVLLLLTAVLIVRPFVLSAVLLSPSLFVSPFVSFSLCVSFTFNCEERAVCPVVLCCLRKEKRQSVNHYSLQLR